MHGDWLFTFVIELPRSVDFTLEPPPHVTKLALETGGDVLGNEHTEGESVGTIRRQNAL